MHQQRKNAQHRPEGKDNEIERSQALDPDRMKEIDRHEGQHHRDEDDDRSRDLAGIDDEQREHHHVPDDGKAGEEIFVRLHAHVGIVDRAGHDDDAGGDEGPGFADHAALIEREGWQEDIGDVIDDIVERIARPVRQHFLDPHLAGDRPVDAVDGQRKAQPPEHVDEAVLGRGNDAEKGKERAGCREDMDGEGTDFGVGNALVIEKLHRQTHPVLNLRFPPKHAKPAAVEGPRSLARLVARCWR